MAATDTPGRVTAMPAVPGPRPLPIVGRRGTKFLFYHDPIAYHRHVYETYGTLAAFTAGGNKLLIYGPTYNQQVLGQADIFHADRVAAPGPPDSALHRLGSGLNTMSGEVHRRQRRLIQPALHRQHVDTYRDTMVAISEQYLAGWRSGQLRDIAHEMQQLTLCIASTTLFGVDATQDADSLGHLIARWIGLNAHRGVYFFPVDWPGTPFRRLLRLSDQLEAHIREMLDHKRQHTSGQGDVLELLLGARDDDGLGMSEAELIGHTTVLFLAGFETSAVAMTWTLFLLAQHPQVLGDLVDELISVLHGEAPTVAQIASLPLLDQVIKESMRLLPPAIHGGRIAVQPFAMGGYEFPAGTKVMYSEYITHHMAELYPQPERFLPSRWAGPAPAPYAYLAFLAGPRRCLGAEFAMLEMKIALSLILQRFRLALPDQARIDRAVRFTLVPKDGMPMHVLGQDRQFRKVSVRGTIHDLVDLSEHSNVH
ncbi:MAG TPA: cytochrome P450 [Roseiflexaceae bacterium]|nr:cytochrome P450 [Roseiflexaceae bacterium]